MEYKSYDSTKNKLKYCWEEQQNIENIIDNTKTINTSFVSNVYKKLIINRDSVDSSINLTFGNLKDTDKSKIIAYEYSLNNPSFLFPIYPLIWINNTLTNIQFTSGNQIKLMFIPVSITLEAQTTKI